METTTTTLTIQCDAYHPNPAYPTGDYLTRCPQPAQHQLTLLTPSGIYQIARCSACRTELRDGTAMAATEVLDETGLEEVACLGCGRGLAADSFCPHCDFDYSDPARLTAGPNKRKD